MRERAKNALVVREGLAEVDVEERADVDVRLVVHDVGRNEVEVGRVPIPGLLEVGLRGVVSEGEPRKGSERTMVTPKWPSLWIIAGFTSKRRNSPCLSFLASKFCESC